MNLARNPEAKICLPLSLEKGFVLVATIVTLSLVAVLTLGLISISSTSSRTKNAELAMIEAEANAKLALMMAIGQLQEHAGSDLRMTARADLLENVYTELKNPYWVGVWKNHLSVKDVEYHLIGKNAGNSNAPYKYDYIYTDMRQEDASLKGGRWKKSLMQEWLVSRRLATTPETDIKRSGSDFVTILGKGTLGEGSDEEVNVEKLAVKNGSVAWWTYDNSLKANLSLPKESVNDEVALVSSHRVNPTQVKNGADELFSDYLSEAEVSKEKMMSYESMALVSPSSSIGFERGYLDFTHSSPGLFTNPVAGGFKQDLTPVLFGDKESRTFSFAPPFSHLGSGSVTSEHPIIRSARHDVLAPKLGALRYWGLLKYDVSGEADTTFHDKNASLRERPSTNWPHGISDGFTFESSHWATHAPKLHPIMTDVRYHYYFSYEGQTIRTHIIPRVCLWNPYNKPLKTKDLVVLMPNPFKNSGVFHFYIGDGEVERLRENVLAEEDANLHQWVKKEASPLGEKYKLRIRTVKTNGGAGLMPAERFFGFSLKGAEIAPGECQVFSPEAEDEEGISEGGVTIQPYDPTNIAQNILSPFSKQGEDHFYFDNQTQTHEVQIASGSSTVWRSLRTITKNQIDWSKCTDYRMEFQMNAVTTPDGKGVNFPFILKSASAEPDNIESVISSSDFPTLQTVLNGAGGVMSIDYFGYLGSSWGSANTLTQNAFGSLSDFKDNPTKDAPNTHQVGAKLIWLNEESTEANTSGLAAPLRVSAWGADHMAYNPATIANWNVRGQLTTASPVSQRGSWWYTWTTTPWLLQFNPKSPQDVSDQPSINDANTAFVKQPLGLALDFPIDVNTVLFDLPDVNYGALSMASLRHASLTPYSWHPSYIIGQSLPDLHAPTDATAIAELDSSYTAKNSMPTHWDFLLGCVKHTGSVSLRGRFSSQYKHGARSINTDSQGLLQIGNQNTGDSVAGVSLTSGDDILAYDIAFETNQNLWDYYFLSGMKLDGASTAFESGTNQPRYAFNKDVEQPNQADHDLAYGYFLNAYLLKNEIAFNVNSTSVNAWKSIISSSLGVGRKLATEVSDGKSVTTSRIQSPGDVVSTDEALVAATGGFQGGRELSESEVQLLAEKLVEQVKLRGPFISIADFINRRLGTDSDPASHRGTVALAIEESNLNEEFLSENEYLISHLNAGNGSDTSITYGDDNNYEGLKSAYKPSAVTTQPAVKSYGLPGYLIQTDILEPIVPLLTIRGDSYTVRAYGESLRDGEVIATAVIEATVVRSPHYLEHNPLSNPEDSSSDYPTTPVTKVDPFTGEQTDGSLTAINKKYGRKFIIREMKWLSKDQL